MNSPIITESLSPASVLSIFKSYNNGGEIDIWEYNKVISVDDIDHLFIKNRRACIIFYPAFEANGLQIGHYVSLCRDFETNTYSYYDSLAYRPDEYKTLSNQREKLYVEQYNTLVKLFLDKLLRGVTVDYNTKAVQSRSTKVATCGRWAVLRCTMCMLSNDEFNRGVDMMRKLFSIEGTYSDAIFLYI